MANKVFTDKSLETLVNNIKTYVNNSASIKADVIHSHIISDVTGLQSTLDGKAATNHGVHVSYSSTLPVMDGSASVGMASTVARSDHKHPTDTSRAAQADLDIIEFLVSINKAAIEANASALKTMQTNIDSLAAQVRANEENLANFVAISTQEINALAK